MKVIVIGGVAAGMSAASKIKRLDYSSQVTVYERGSDISYGACGMPYMISGVIDSPETLVVRKKEDFEKMDINIKLQNEVIAVDEGTKTVTVKDNVTGQVFADCYDKLVITTGASPILPPIKNIGLEGVFVLSSLNDGRILREKLQDRNIKNVIIVGAGFIGVELCEAMREINKEVTLIEFKNQILPNFDKDVVAQLQDELKRNYVDVRLSEKVVSFEGSSRVQKVITDKNRYVADCVIMCVGVKPNTDFLKSTGIELLTNGAIKVDKHMQTSIKDIYAAGDCSSVYHKVLDDLNRYIPLGTNANKQGRIAGEVVLGKNSKFDSSLGTSMIKVCDMEGAKTGISEAEAILSNFDYKAVTITSLNHAVYYPDSSKITIKLVYDKKTKMILGAQIVGEKDCAIRIDVFAVAIHTGMTTDEFAMLDFGYSPPFSGVWDAMHIAANQAK